MCWHGKAVTLPGDVMGPADEEEELDDKVTMVC